MKPTSHAYHQWIDQLLSEGKTVQVPVYGMSMFPVLLPRDLVQIQKQPIEALKKGQVLVFETGGQWIAHRLTGKDPSTGLLFTRGDGLPRKDAPVAVEKAKGVITRVVRSRSPFAYTINTPIDRLMVWWGPWLGHLFFWLGRAVIKIRLCVTPNK